MPGVPSGRACEECRRQKKKCDEGQPRCARCARLNLECVGSGVRRFKFQNNGVWSRSASPMSTGDDSVTLSIRKSPDIAAGSLRRSLIKAMLPSTDFRYNLAWTYGDYYQFIPQRIGVNIALDSALEALVSAHSDVCSLSQRIRPQTLLLHSQALQNLMSCLDDPSLASTTETLGAVMVLLTLQAFIGANKNYWSQHYVGAAQILKARNYRHAPNDAFETILLATLRGPVLMEGILSGKLHFTADEWRNLMHPYLEDESLNERVVRCISQIPELLHRRRELRDLNESWNESLELQLESRKRYEEAKGLANEWSSMLDSILDGQAHSSVEAVAGLPLEPVLRRQYGLCLFFTITLNLLLRSFPNYDHNLLEDGEYFADEIMVIAEEAMPYKPLGSSYATLCLAAAYVATADEKKRNYLSGAFRMYADDFAWAKDYRIDSWCCTIDDTFQLPGIKPMLPGIEPL